MGRYLLIFSYVGTGFSGLQQQKQKVPTIIGTLQDVINMWLHPSNPVHLTSSSRTDRGVHALCNTAHVDLVHPKPGHAYHPDVITATTNEALMLMKAPVRVVETLRVKDDFHCRFNATSRTYLYRIVHCKQPHLGWTIPFMPFEYQQIFPVRGEVDMDKVKEAARLLTGTHDFTSFTTRSMLEKAPWQNPVKTLEVEVQQSEGFLQHHQPNYDDNFTNWDFLFRGSSFLYRQVRKMTGVMLGVGRGVLGLDVVHQMLEQPGEIELRKTDIFHIPPYALYLKQVHYLQQDLLPPEDSNDIIDDTPMPVEIKPKSRREKRRKRIWLKTLKPYEGAEDKRDKITQKNSSVLESGLVDSSEVNTSIQTCIISNSHNKA